MSAEQIFHNLSHKQRIKVLDLTLPGIEAFLKDVLAKESLSEDGETLRCRYLEMIKHSSEDVQDDKDGFSPVRNPEIKGTSHLFKNIDAGDGESYSEQSPTLRNQDMQPARTSTSRKGTDSTEESGVFFRTQYLPSVSSGSQDTTLYRHSDTFESTSSRDTFVSDSEVEFLEWDADLMEDGYSTGDNMEGIAQNINTQPNEHGEIYSGVLYIREQPGWHKRWFVLTDTCLKCYKYKRDEKMLFEIPLRNAKFVSTDRKRSRMYSITLSIARLKDDITFATTDEKSRHEWFYVINHVIKNLYPESESLSSDLIANTTDCESQCETSDASPKNSHNPEDFLKRRTWHSESDSSMKFGSDRLNGGGKMGDLDVGLHPSLAEEESFKEVQEYLPDILTRPKSRSWKGDLNRTKAKENVQYRKSISFSPSVENNYNEDSSSVPRVKRHGSLANSLTNKAARVRSKLSTSFFKKGKKDDKPCLENSSQSTTFSGYLLRKKGNAWKNRWCVVKNNSLFCYKAFGASLPELELTLDRYAVKTLPDREEDKPYSFVLSAEKERLLFAAEDNAELEEWLDVFEKEVGNTDDNEINVYPLNEANPTTLSSRHSVQIESAGKTKFTENDINEVSKNLKEKEVLKVNKDVSKRSTLLGTIAHKLGKHSLKCKETHDDKLDGIRKQIEEFNIESDQFKETKNTALESGPSNEGVLFCQYEDKYIESKVILRNHKLEVEPLEQSVDKTFPPTNFRLINCIVLDCSDTEGPLSMVVKRNIGEPLYLRSQTLEEFQTWKDVITAASLTTPSSIERLLSITSSDGEPQVDVPNGDPIRGDSIDGDDVFVPSTPLSLTKDDFKNCENNIKEDVKSTYLRRAYSAGGIDRMRSLHQGYLVYSKRKQSPIRRTFSNVMSSLDLAPKQKRSKTFAGLGINSALLLGIKYSSSVYLRVTKELWVQRWCVVQNNNLHFFLNPDDLTPRTSLGLTGCNVEEANVKGKNFAFKLTLPSEKIVFYFAVDSEREQKSWMELFWTQGQRSQDGSNKNLQGVLLSKVKSESNIVSQEDSCPNERGLWNMSKSLVELRKISEQGKKNLKESNSNFIKSSAVITQRPTSLQEVLQLLQEQQLMQSMGHQRYVRVKKARGNWKKSAAAVIRDAQSNPESPETSKNGILKSNEENRDSADPELIRKPRGTSTGSANSYDLTEALSSYEISDDYLGKRAEEEKLKVLKTETLLRKRRNSLNLEKEVLEKKLGKEEKRDKKTGVKKLLGKDAPKDNEEITRTKKKLDEVNLKLANIDQDMLENKTKEAAIMENITTLKTRSLRKASTSGENLTSDQVFRSILDEKRSRYRDSPTGSTSSRDSFEDKAEGYRSSERSSSMHRKGSKNKASQSSLKALEEELLKISPRATRKKRPNMVKRISSSSEGSIEDCSLRASPSFNQRYSNEAPSGSRLSQSHDKLFGWDSVEARKKRQASLLITSSKGDLSPTTVERSNEANSDGVESSNPKAGEHRPSLITALSQIKDFEEFLEINRRR